MKYLVKLGVIMLVVVLPAGSWYYLQTGLNYRKAALEELKPKGVFDSTLLTEGDLLSSNTSLIQLSDDVDNAFRIYDQYKEAESFQILSREASLKSDKWLEVSDKSLSAINGQFPDAHYILIDTAKNIRHVYVGHENDDIKEVVSHVAMVLPRKKDKDIKMKRK